MNDPLAGRSAWVGWILSIALHGALVILANVALAPPDTGFEFTAPVEVELGLVDATEVEVEPPAGAPEVPSEASSGAGEGEGAVADAGPRASDGGDRDAGDAARRRRRDAGVDGATGPGIGAGPPVAFLPSGAQLALRIDMDRVRSSPVGEDIAGLLRVVPDWQALLGASGVDPVRDLSRVLIATPTVQRSTVIVAGRLSDGAPAPRDVAERMASAQGVEIAWRDEAGVPATRWPSPDGTERDVALIGDRHFVIARPADLPRVLAIAAARRGRRAEAGGSAADALLSMEPGEGLSIEVENVPLFLRRSPCPIPQTLRAGVVEHDDGVMLRGQARFTNHDDAEVARECLLARAEQAASNMIVTLYGLNGPLERLDLRVEGSVLHLESAMRFAEIRTIAGLLRGLLERPSAPPPAALTPAAPAPPPQPVLIARASSDGKQ